MAEAKREINNGTAASKVILAKPRLGSFGLGASDLGASSSHKDWNTLGPVLRPPQLKSNSNPFLKVPNILEEKEVKESSSSTPSNDAKSSEEAPKFVPLASTIVASRTNNPTSTPVQPTSSSSSGFVFGQNLSDRVVIKENINNGEAVTDHTFTNGSSELLFTSAAASVKETNQEDQNSNETNSSGDGLAAAAAEYERSHARPPPPTTNVTMTGEEGENNVMQMSCRLFAWESGSWRERGRGVLRLNDAAAGGGAARLVARVSGSLRVALNTKLWPDMVVERAGNKSLRITAADAHHQVKLYLIMGAPGDIAQLNRALLARVSGIKRTSNTSKSASQKAAERLEAATDEESLVANNESNKETTGDNEIDPVASCDEETHERIAESETKGDMEETSVDEADTERSLKRKEPAEDVTPPKRQCPDISE